MRKDTTDASPGRQTGLRRGERAAINDRALDVRYVRLKPYNLDGRVLVDVQQIIPLPEAAAYTVRVAKRDQQQKAAREAERDYTRFDPRRALA